MHSEITYPTRCEIINVDGLTVSNVPMITPEVSKPHIGKKGWARSVDSNVEITLDDGTHLLGVECWWKQVAFNVCRYSVLQDSVCILEANHFTPHRDKEGFEVCIICRSEITTWGHKEGCPLNVAKQASV